MNEYKRLTAFLARKAKENECEAYLDILALINELESDNKSLQDLCNKTYEDLTKEIDRLENLVKGTEEGIEIKE